MRDIKFRAWDEEENKMIEWHDTFFSDMSSVTQWSSDFSYIEMPLMQYTGLKDKYDKEIYEGDIVDGFYEDYSDYDHENYIIEFRSVVEFSNGAYCIKRKYLNDEARIREATITKHWDSETVEVIGNIYENPELVSM